MTTVNSRAISGEQNCVVTASGDAPASANATTHTPAGVTVSDGVVYAANVAAAATPSVTLLAVPDANSTSASGSRNTIANTAVISPRRLSHTDKHKPRKLSAPDMSKRASYVTEAIAQAQRDKRASYIDV